MAEINIIEIDTNTFQVTISAQTTTTHQVTVLPEYAQKLTVGKISTVELVKKSFEFLLARESNNSILRQFDLSVIARYFPEYEAAIVK
jgi:hypothetical protein